MFWRRRKLRIDEDGDKFWYLNGKLHRLDGPAAITAAGSKWWYKNGKKHREDGPAVIFANGRKEWWLNNKEYSFDSWLKELDVSDDDKLFLKLKLA